MRILLALLLLAPALAGCNQLSEAVAEAELLYNGSGNGNHSDKAACDADGTIHGNGEITDGQVRVTVTDSDGSNMFADTFSGDFSMSKRSLTGDSGEWTIRAVRSGDDLIGDAFAGEYAFFLNC